MAAITSIVYSPAGAQPHPADAYQRTPLEKADLIEGRGILGDRKGGSPKRQLNIMLAETVDELSREGFKTGPGEMGEQIVIGWLDPALLTPGQTLQLGAAACVELVSLRTGCDRFEHIQGHAPEEAAGRLGVMARVVASGPIAAGDPVIALSAAAEPGD